jgi:hypothetical protein
VAFLILAGLLFAIVGFRFLNPAITPVMISEKLRGTTFARHWVPLANISPNLPLVVIASEDGRFCDHWGVDWSAVKEAVEAADDFSDFRGARRRQAVPPQPSPAQSGKTPAATPSPGVARFFTLMTTPVALPHLDGSHRAMGEHTA